MPAPSHHPTALRAVQAVAIDSSLFPLDSVTASVRLRELRASVLNSVNSFVSVGAS